MTSFLNLFVARAVFENPWVDFAACPCLFVGCGGGTSLAKVTQHMRDPTELVVKKTSIMSAQSADPLLGCC